VITNILEEVAAPAFRVEVREVGVWVGYVGMVVGDSPALAVAYEQPAGAALAAVFVSSVNHPQGSASILLVGPQHL
jgi:hypothetical protein